MELGAAGLHEQPFRVHGKPLAYVTYESQLQAHEFIRSIYEHQTGLGLFHGPGLSGKTTIIRSFAESLGREGEVAVIDGAGLNTTALLEAVLGKFGYELDLSGVNELINMLKVYLMQRTATAHAPLLIIENTHAMNPSALRVLCELAKLRVKQYSALRLVLASDRSMEGIIRSPAMECIAERITGSFYLGPLNEFETTDYLYEKLRAGGCIDPQNVIPEAVCDEFYVASGGWPGILDRLVLLALAKASHCPLKKSHVERPVLPDLESGGFEAAEKGGDGSSKADTPELIMTSNGRTLANLTMQRPRLIIGRSDHNDLRIDSKFISRHHALLIRHGKATFLMDLNSTNGTFVNSKRVSNQVMMHNDIITLGNHRIKFVHPQAQDGVDLQDANFADTVIMKNLQDMRRMLARENTQSMPIPEAGKSSSKKNDD